jgi:hypothetical protein
VVDALPATVTDAGGNTYTIDEQGNMNPIDSEKDIDEVIVQGLSDSYEILINDDTEKTTTDRKLKLVYEQQKINMKLQKNNGDTIKVANIQWQITNGKQTETIDSTLTKDIMIADKDVKVLIYEKVIEKGKEKKAKIAEYQFVVKQSPYIKFSTLSGYDGEFGFDDGEDFKESDKPKRDMQYDTIHVADANNKTKVLYVPWLTLAQGQTAATLKVDISKEIEGDSIYVESTLTNVIANYNRQQKQLTITNNSLNNDFSKPEYINFYRDDENKLQKRMLIGRCAIVGRPLFSKTINVQIVYFSADTTKVKNTINTTRLQNLLNSNSLNQSFARFVVLPNVINVKDTLNSVVRADYRKAYESILRICAKKGMMFTMDQHPTTVYIVMTELQFTKSENNGITEERGGGVMDNSNLAVMWTISNSSEDKEKLIIHEIGHTLGLSDAFNDNALGNPPKKFSRHNYMDYDIVRKMFFKTQMGTIINNLKKGEDQ